MTDFADYTVFVDETGDHGLEKVNEHYPMFGLSFCIFKKDTYATKVVPRFTAFKFQHWGHDAAVLHEREIRKEEGHFAFLMTSKQRREGFLSDLSNLISETEMSIIAVVVHKQKHLTRYPKPWNPYEIALHLGLERLLQFMLSNRQAGKTVHVIFECRNPDLDRDLELEFRRIVGGISTWGYRTLRFDKVQFEPLFVKKSANSIGLQLADLTARPLALKILRPEQDNRAYDVLMPKIASLKAFP